jgi:hypothetical protein
MSGSADQHAEYVAMGDIAPVARYLGEIKAIQALADALHERGLRHGYAAPLGKIDVEEVARWALEAMAQFDGPDGGAPDES